MSLIIASPSQFRRIRNKIWTHMCVVLPFGLTRDHMAKWRATGIDGSYCPTFNWYSLLCLFACWVSLHHDVINTALGFNVEGYELGRKLAFSSYLISLEIEAALCSSSRFSFLPNCVVRKFTTSRKPGAMIQLAKMQMVQFLCLALIHLQWGNG